MPVSWSTALKNGETAEDLPVNRSAVPSGLVYSSVWWSNLHTTTLASARTFCAPEVDEVVTKATLNNVRRHTYLKLEMVVFRQASEAVNADNRVDIASTLLTRPDDLETEESADSAANVIDQQTRLPDLVDRRSWLVFQL